VAAVLKKSSKIGTVKEKDSGRENNSDMEDNTHLEYSTDCQYKNQRIQVDYKVLNEIEDIWLEESKEFS